MHVMFGNANCGRVVGLYCTGPITGLASCSQSVRLVCVVPLKPWNDVVSPAWVPTRWMRMAASPPPKVGMLLLLITTHITPAGPDAALANT